MTDTHVLLQRMARLAAYHNSVHDSETADVLTEAITYIQRLTTMIERTEVNRWHDKARQCYLILHTYYTEEALEDNPEVEQALADLNSLANELERQDARFSVPDEKPPFTAGAKGK